MQGIDSVTGPNTNNTSWLVSSAPQPVGFLNVVPDAAQGPGNNRIRFYNANAPNDAEVIFQTIGVSNSTNGNSVTNFANVPAYGGHVFAQTGQANDADSVLQFPYSNLTNQRWGGLRQVLSTNGTDLSNTTYMSTWL